VLRNPITGIAGCCARAARGHDVDRAAEKRDELASFHSITSSARSTTTIDGNRPARGNV
jgi:hypothetical protein